MIYKIALRKNCRKKRKMYMSKVLIVEDEEIIAELEKDYLELSGFEVDVLSDGKEGLKAALDNN